MDFEFEAKLKDGRLVNVVGTADVLHACDCDGEAHLHIDDMQIESVMQLWDSGTIEGREIERDERVMLEIERKAEAHIYSEYEMEAAS
jgi:hypothetical protein